MVPQRARVPAACGVLAGAAWLGGCGAAGPVAHPAASLLVRAPDAVRAGTDGGQPAVDVDERVLVLVPGAGATYGVGVRAASRLALEGRAEQSGRLELELALQDPATGRLEVLTDPPLALEVDEGRLARRVPLPAPRDAVVRCSLTWRPDGGAGELELRRLRVVEDERLARPPIVFVSVDTLGARHMSLYGYERPTTPSLEAFAERAVVFDACRANAPWTLPSYLSQMSGQFPRTHHLPPASQGERRPLHDRLRLRPRTWTLAELLRSVGYRTAAFVDNPMIANSPGFDQGFDHYDDSAARIAHTNAQGGMRRVFPLALEWLDALPDGEPYFLFVHVLDCHGPYLPEEPYAEAFADDELDPVPREVPVLPGRPPVYRSIPEYIARRGELPGADLPGRMRTRPLVDAYDEKVLEVDRFVGDFLDALAARPGYDGAVVVFSADHGESLLGHGWYFRHTSVYGETVDVPLVVRLPGDRGAGRRVAEPVQLVDVYPTLLELVGLSPYDHLHGRSLVPLLEGAAEPPAALLTEGNMMAQVALEYDGWKLVRYEPGRSSDVTMLSHDETRADFARFVGLEDDRVVAALARLDERASDLEDELDAFRRHLRREGPRYELYHLEEDPEERVDLAQRHPERVAALRDRLEELLDRAEAARSDEPVEEVSLSPETLRELERLGYAE